LIVALTVVLFVGEFLQVCRQEEKGLFDSPIITNDLFAIKENMLGRQKVWK
jgi:hypothetical protein